MLTRLKFPQKAALIAAAVLFGNTPLMAMQSPARPLPSLDAVINQIGYYTPEIAFTGAGLALAYMLLVTFILWRMSRKRGLPTDQG